jgi:hypothetical protein
MTRAIESYARVLVMGRDVHLLQCYLDRNSIASIALASNVAY